MNKRHRRAFLQTSAGALAANLGPAALAKLNLHVIRDAIATRTGAAQVAQPVASNEGRKPLRLGLIIGVGEDPDASMAKVHDLGLPTCQAFVDDFKPGLAERLRQALDKHGIEATSLVVGGPGKEVWDFYQGPLTIGLVPRDTRAARIAHIKKASDFAKQCGIPAVQTHCGFIPENPNDALYRETVAAMREVAAYCKGNGQDFRY
jgi:L-ribulose-5-phosphate 3-epimerase